MSTAWRSISTEDSLRKCMIDKYHDQTLQRYLRSKQATDQNVAAELAVETPVQAAMRKAALTKNGRTF